MNNNLLPKLFVLGNGPSLKGFDFNKLNNYHTIGLNVAYRYWEKINWYPTYYCCLDPELINTHHDKIYEMLKENKVKKMFLRGNMLKYHPDLKNNENVYFLEAYWNPGMAKKIGVKYEKNLFFNTTVSGKITTGSYSIRFGMLLGYKDINLLGIDCRYVEFIKECKKEGKYKLSITETPKNNPNYFFNEYQQKGDTYQIPNPTCHNGILHVQTFKILKIDIVKFKMGVTITNRNKESIIYDENIFPFKEFE